MIIIFHYENDINKGVGFGVGSFFFTLMLDGGERGKRMVAIESLAYQCEQGWEALREILHT